MVSLVHIIPAQGDNKIEFSVRMVFFDGRWVVVSPLQGWGYASYLEALEDAVKMAREESLGIVVVFEKPKRSVDTQ